MRVGPVAVQGLPLWVIMTERVLAMTDIWCHGTQLTVRPDVAQQISLKPVVMDSFIAFMLVNNCG